MIPRQNDAEGHLYGLVNPHPDKNSAMSEVYTRVANVLLNNKQWTDKQILLSRMSTARGRCWNSFHSGSSISLLLSCTHRNGTANLEISPALMDNIAASRAGLLYAGFLSWMPSDHMGIPSPLSILPSVLLCQSLHLDSGFGVDAGACPILCARGVALQIHPSSNEALW